LLVGTEFADFIEEKESAVSFAEEAGPIALGTGEGASYVAEEGGGGGVAPESGTVYLDKTPF